MHRQIAFLVLGLAVVLGAAARAEEKKARKEAGGEGGAPIMTLEEMGLPPRVIPEGE